MTVNLLDLRKPDAAPQVVSDSVNAATDMRFAAEAIPPEDRRRG